MVVFFVLLVTHTLAVVCRWGYNTDSAAEIATENGFLVAENPADLAEL